MTARTPDHYATLGVDPGASAEEVRRAYLDGARRLHPDRWVDASPARQAEAETDMQALNEAWRVLGNPGRRIAYDADRRRPAEVQAKRAAATGDGFAFSSGSLFGDDVPELGTLAKLVRVLPWIVIFLVLGGIFVFTAYAPSNGGGASGGGGGAEPIFGCVVLEGARALEAPCSDDGARTVVTEVVEVGQCPFATEPFQPRNSQSALCLER